MIGQIAVQFEEKEHGAVADFAIGEISRCWGGFIEPFLNKKKKVLVGVNYRASLRRNRTYRPASKMADYILDDIFSGIA